MTAARRIGAEAPLLAVPGVFSALRPLENVGAQYARLVFGAGAEAFTGGDALLIAGDWRQWREARANGTACVHYESVLGEGPDLETPERDLYLRYTDWMFEGGNDLTDFDGVSLGGLFWRETTLACRERDRQASAVRRLLTRFRPREVLIAGDGLPGRWLDGVARRELIAACAAEAGIRVVAADAPPRPAPALSRRGRVRAILKAVYAAAADALFDLNWRLGGRKPKVFFITNGILHDSVFAAAARFGFAPVLPADHWPKTPGFLWRCWREGVVLAAFPNGALNGKESAEIECMAARVLGTWRGRAPSWPEDIRRGFIRRVFFESGTARALAERTKSYRRLFARHAFARIVVGDSTGAEGRLAAECARVLGIGVDEAINGIVLATPRCESRVGRGARRGVVDRILAWGPAVAAWAAAAAPGLPVARVGYAPGGGAVRPEKSGPLVNALILPCYADSLDVHALESNTMAYLLDTVRAFAGAGAKRLRIKLHPGMPLSESEVAAAVAELDIPVEVRREGGVAEHVAWADAVAGPVNSGAWAEALVAGVPYYPLLYRPTSMDVRFLEDVAVFADAAELARALAAGAKPDRRKALRVVCAIPEIGDPAGAFWRAIEATIGKRN
jgi:hypothetical protein